jgi:hypothetical protein
MATQYEVWEMNFQSLAVAGAALLGVVLTISGCSSAQSDWTKATSENTVFAYQDFLTAHPKDHYMEAQAEILQLQDDNGWIEAQHTGTIAAYQTYIQQFPQGSHVAAAHDATTSMDRAAAWKAARSNETTVGVEAFLQKYPTGPEADQAQTTLKDLTGYRVRLASLSSDHKAERKLIQLKARFGDQLHDLVVTPDANRKSYFIDSGGMTEQGATHACESIKHKHLSCQVVHL